MSKLLTKGDARALANNIMLELVSRYSVNTKDGVDVDDHALVNTIAVAVNRFFGIE